MSDDWIEKGLIAVAIIVILACAGFPFAVIWLIHSLLS